jgi:DHA1 family quinolone resistance protein-like MFS transporter
MKDFNKLIPIQFLSNSALFASALFIPILAGELSASDFQVGLIVAAYGFALFISNYVFGRYSDIHGKKLFLQLGLVLTGFACLIQILGTNVWTLVLARIIVGFCAGIYPSALLAKAYLVKGEQIGKFTSFGSFGWSFGILMAGLLSIYWKIFLFSSVMFFGAFVVANFVSFKDDVKICVPLFPKDVIKRSLPAYIAMLVRHTGAMSLWTIFQLYLYEDLGGSLLSIAILYALNPLGQFFVMQVIDKYQSTKLITAGLLISIVSFSGMTLVTEFWHMVIPWVILSLAWGFLYVGSIKFVMERNVEKATCTGILNSTLNMSGIIGAVMGGLVAWHFGRVANILLAASMSILALILFILLLQKMDEENNPVV